MKKLCLFLIAFAGVYAAVAQPIYTGKKYANRSTKNIVYGIDTTYSGHLDSLKMDLYTPINDSNCNRPILVVVHGGAWIGGDKAGGFIPQLCKEFAARGYLVASVNYRMGMHPAGFYVPYAICPHEKCSYVADSAEWYRAAYRAAQDVKSAVRYMKNRSHLDSSDKNNVFLLGESAGAFTTYLAAWMDQDSEKPAQCKSIADAPNPDADLNSCVIQGTRKTRPDMGPVHGYGNLGNNDSKVKGVAAFYGGVLDTSIFRQQQTTDTPVLYMFHQTCDVVVDNNKGRLFWKVFYHCYAPLNLCQPFGTGPVSWGTTAIKSHIDGMTGPKPYYQYTLLTNLGSYSCDVNSNCHGIDNLPNRSAEVAAFFSPVIQKSGNKPGLENCNVNTQKAVVQLSALTIYPTPCSEYVILEGHGLGATIQYQIFTMDGKLLAGNNISNSGLTTKIMLPQHLKSGCYAVVISTPYGRKTFQIIIQK
ncbi:MAG: carboxylesterase family protein [Bacteroidia bacterium]|nr:carboxylesterase family protein [Bacteroidia bacterium]